jgi:hypothetical protein
VEYTPELYFTAKVANAMARMNRWTAMQAKNARQYRVAGSSVDAWLEGGSQCEGVGSSMKGKNLKTL